MAGGYSHSFVEPPSKDLRWQCHICQGILRKPVLVTCCGGKFCRSCISEWRSRKNIECPLCRRKYDVAPEKDLERVLLDKKVSCSHQDRGCRWKGALRNVEEHEKKDCHYVFVNCPYEFDSQVLKLNVKTHQKKCHKRPKPCEFAIYGCKQAVQYNQKDSHCMSHSQHHLTLVLSELNKKEEELQVARKDAVSHQSKLQQVERHVRETEEHCRKSEKALQQTKVKLHLEQQRCEESKINLQQTEGELQKARELVTTTQSKLSQTEESLKTKEQHCQRLKDTLRLHKEQKRMKEEKAQHTKGKLGNVTSYGVANTI